MRFAVSNIALPAYDHEAELHVLAALGFSGLEVAPSRAWKDTWNELSPTQVEAYRKRAEAAGLSVIGLHSLLYDRPTLSLCDTPETRRSLLDFFVHLSAVCRDLGGRTLIWGGGRRRGATSQADAKTIIIEFFGQLAQKIEEHGTCYCLEPLAPDDTDFIHTVSESFDIVGEVGHDSLQVQIDAKALAANEELTANTFEAVKSRLVHYHANEPGFEALGGGIDHELAGECLRRIGYDGFVSLEQKMIGVDPINAVQQSVKVMEKAYR